MRLLTSIVYFISLLVIHTKAFKTMFMGDVRIDDISWLQISFLRLCNPRGKTLFIWCFLSKANTNKAFSFIFYFLKSNILFYLAMKFMSLQSDGTQRTITQFYIRDVHTFDGKNTERYKTTCILVTYQVAFCES